MPDDRLLSPRAGRSNKIAQLTWRGSWVWATYLLAADDFGVMQLDPYAIQALDTRLRREASDDVEADLRKMVEIGLVLAFSDADGHEYICDPIWQDFQKVRWPKVKTTMPCPPEDVLKKCCRCTVELLKKHRRFPKSFRISQSYNASCLQAKGLRLEAKGLEGGEGETDNRQIGADLRAVISAYYDKFKAKFGVKPQFEGGKDAAIMQGLLKKYGSDQTVKLLDRFFASSDPFIANSGYTVGVFKSQVNKLLIDTQKADAGTRLQGCRHNPPCVDAAAHTKRDLEDRRRVS